MNINRLIKLIFTTILMMQFSGCSSGNDDNVLQPDSNVNTRYLSVRHLQFSSSNVDFEEQSLGAKTVKSFSVANREKNYPIKFSIEGIPNNITLLDTSTCPKDNATVYPGDECVYSMLLSNDENGDQLDNITFYDNYSEVDFEVKSKVTAQSVGLLNGTAQSVGLLNDTAQSVGVSNGTAQSVGVSNGNAQSVGVLNDTAQSVGVSKTIVENRVSANFPLTVNKEYHSYGSVDIVSKNSSTDFIISNRSSTEVNFDISSLTSGGYIVHPVSTCVVGANKLSAGQSCLIQMVFSPSSSTIYNDIFQVSYGSEKISISLTGVGAKKYADINSLTLIDNFIDYGTVAKGEFKAYSIRIKNNSNDSFMKFSLSDIEGGFSYLPSSTCGIYFTTLPPNQSCELFVRYISANGGGAKVWINNLFKDIEFLSNSSEEDILSIGQSVVDFDNILEGSVNNNTFTVNNISNLDQFIDITTSDDITINNLATTIPALSSTEVNFSLQPKNVDRDFKRNIKISTSDGSGYILPVKAEVVASSNIDMTQFLSSKSIGEKVYIYDDNMLIYNPLIDNKSNQLYNYNLSSLKWTQIEYTGDAPEHGIGTELLFFNDAFYLFGGEDKDGNLDDNLSYFDTVNKKWNEILIGKEESKPTARKGYKGVVEKDKLYIMGGIDSNGNYLDDIWVYDLNRNSNGWSKVEISPLFTVAEINDSSTIFHSENNRLYIVVANKVYSYKINDALIWQEEYDLIGVDVLRNIDAIISNNVLYLTGSKTSNDKLFLSKLDMITGKVVEIETDVTTNDNVKSILYSNNDGLIYLFLMFDDKVSSELYYLNDINSKFVEIDTQIYPYRDVIDASVLYKEYIYSLSSDKKLYSYNLNKKRFEYKNSMSCTVTSTDIKPHFITDNSRNKLYALYGSGLMCEYDIETGLWTDISVAPTTGVSDNFSVAIYDNHLWLYGGIKNDNTVSDELWKYDITFGSGGSSGWVKVQISRSSTLSSSGALGYGVYDHKVVVYGDSLYIVGGYLDLLKDKNNSIFKIDLSQVSASMTIESRLDELQQLSDNFGVAPYKSGFVLLGLDKNSNNILYYNVVDSEFSIYSSIGGDYFDKEYVSKVISFGSGLYLQNNLYSRVSKIVLQ